MSIVICPGIHEPSLTENFISKCLFSASESLEAEKHGKILIFPGHGLLALSSLHILHFLSHGLQDDPKSPIILISFSAGVLGAMGAACAWQILGGKIKAFIAIDGWGVPLWGDFPIHRLSHDYFTHWSSSLLGGGHRNFYAEPPVEHLSMWRWPELVKGWCIDESVDNPQSSVPLTAMEFLQMVIKDCEDN
jgi:hypothetical protein